MGYLLKTVERNAWNQAKRKKCVAVNEAEKNGRYEEGFQIRHSDGEFGIFSS